MVMTVGRTMTADEAAEIANSIREVAIEKMSHVLRAAGFSEAEIDEAKERAIQTDNSTKPYLDLMRKRTSSY